MSTCCLSLAKGMVAELLERLCGKDGPFWSLGCPEQSELRAFRQVNESNCQGCYKSSRLLLGLRYGPEGTHSENAELNTSIPGRCGGVGPRTLPAQIGLLRGSWVVIIN